jgi:aspartate/methionine/tyrosine aminotransferase
VPRFPSLSAPTQALPASSLDDLKRRAAASAGDVIPLHIGDTVLLRRPGLDPEQLLESLVTPGTGAIYVCTPNSPDGKVLLEEELAALAGAAFRHDYRDWARLCFTSVDRPRLDRALDRIARVLGP